MSAPSDSLNGLLEAATDALLLAHRDERLVEVLDEHPLARRWLQRRVEPTLAELLGTAPGTDEARVQAAAWVLRLALAGQRPDRARQLGGVSPESWLYRTSWRPYLAAAAHYGFLAVPALEGRRLSARKDNAVDALCQLWSVGPSTLYRYLDKGRARVVEQLAGFVTGGLPVTALLGLMKSEQAGATTGAGGVPVPGATTAPPGPAPFSDAWHRAQAARSEAAGRFATALWHLTEARAEPDVLRLLRGFTQDLAPDPAIDEALRWLRSRPLAPAMAFDLHIAEAALHRLRKAERLEQQACEQALQIASAQGDALRLARAHRALGRLFESRDSDRAISHLEAAVEWATTARPGGVQALPEAVEEQVLALDGLAWMHLLRNDPRARTLLAQAEQLAATAPMPLPVRASLAQTRSELWRRAGDPSQAITHGQRALLLYEQARDARKVMTICTNLGMLYAELRQVDKALEYGHRVLAAARQHPVEPYVLAATHINLGMAHFWQDDFDRAIEHYATGLEISEQARLPVHANRARYNLAEAHYHRFKQRGEAHDAERADALSRSIQAAPSAEVDRFLQEAAANLKTEVLGTAGTTPYQRLVSQEHAVHPEPMAAIEAQRQRLALPGNPAGQVQAHLEIARRYREMASLEIARAVALIEAHGLQPAMAAELAAIDQWLARPESRRNALRRQWRQQAGDLLAAEQQAQVIDHLLAEGALQKSSYATLCALGLATASKHLRSLAELGLLVQTGNGPSTRYRLPEVPEAPGA